MKIKKRIVFIIIALLTLCTATLWGQARKPHSKELESIGNSIEPAFGAGEQITLAGSYGATLIPNIEAGEVVIRVTKTRVGGVSALNVYGNVKAYPSFRSIFDINDTYQTWFDESTMLPIKHSVRLREGAYRFNSDYLYDWDKMEVHTVYHNLKRPEAKTKTMSLTPNSFDPIALFYNLRNKDMSQFVVDKPLELELVLNDTIRIVSYKFRGREVRKLRRLGSFNTLKFSCTIATSDGESFKEGTELFLWISDDKNKLPLYIETPIKIGSIRGYLINYSGLKHPLDSKIN